MEAKRFIAAFCPGWIFSEQILLPRTLAPRADLTRFELKSSPAPLGGTGSNLCVCRHSEPWISWVCNTMELFPRQQDPWILLFVHKRNWSNQFHYFLTESNRPRINCDSASNFPFFLYAVSSWHASYFFFGLPHCRNLLRILIAQT